MSTKVAVRRGNTEGAIMSWDISILSPEEMVQLPAGEKLDILMAVDRHGICLH